MGRKVGHDATEPYQMTQLPFVLYIVDICIYKLIFPGMDETAMKTLLSNPGMEFFATS